MTDEPGMQRWNRRASVVLAAATVLGAPMTACGNSRVDDGAGSTGGPPEGAPSATVVDDGDGVRRVPEEFPTVQAALDAAVDGDTVLVAPGIWSESIRMPSAAVTLASRLILDGDTAAVERTVIDGGGEDWVLRFDSTAGHSRIIGLTLRNAEDCIFPHAPFDFVAGVVTGCVDGIDYEAGSGGRLADSRLSDNRDDGVDLDGDVVVVIEGNDIRDNAQDGIEMRFQPWTGPVRRTVIRGNVITRNGQDGIQFIGYAEPSAREILVEDNRILDNGMAGIGCMDRQDTQEDYRAARLAEPITLRGNTFEGNGRAISCTGLTDDPAAVP